MVILPELRTMGSSVFVKAPSARHVPRGALKAAARGGWPEEYRSVILTPESSYRTCSIRRSAGEPRRIRDTRDPDSRDLRRGPQLPMVGCPR